VSQPVRITPLEEGAAAVNRFRALLRADQSCPILIAHRGDSAHAPENTLEAAQRGWESGADAWELDVQLTRDRVPVVIHDESLVRTTDAARRFAGDPRAGSGFRVAEFDLEEVRALDAGSWFVDPEGGARTAAGFATLDVLSAEDRDRYGSNAVRVPTLAEALELTARLDWLVNVELKSDAKTGPDLLDAVLAVIHATGTAARVLVSSFDHAEVARVARHHPGLASGVLAATPLHRPHVYVRRLVGADAYHASARALGADADASRRTRSLGALRIGDLSALRAAGVPVLVFTVNDAARGGLAARLVEAGVSGLFTDDPARLRHAFEPARRPRDPAAVGEHRRIVGDGR
jgi:glycerophosphoryl diester phosphodiesterase